MDLLITFLHMNSEGVVTIDGVEGTPGADWCVTIVSSDSNGGEYIVTEHQRDSDPPTADGDDDDTAPPGERTTISRYETMEFCDGRDAGERASSAASNPDTFEVRGAEIASVDHRFSRSTTMLKADIIAKHLSVDVSEGGSEVDGSGSEKSQEQLPPAKGSCVSSDGEQQEQQPGIRGGGARRRSG